MSFVPLPTDKTEFTAKNRTLIDLDSSPALFRKILYLSAVGMFMYFFALLTLNSTVERYLAPVLIFFLCVICLWIMRRGNTHTAFLVFSWGSWLALTSQAFVRSGVVNPSLYGYPLLMLLGGWILGVRQGMALGVASLAATFSLAVIEENHWLTPLPPASPFGYWIAVALVLVVGMLIMRHLLQNHWERISANTALYETLQSTISDLQTQQEALRRSEQRFAKISLASPLPIAISSLEDGRYLEVNPAWERVFGWSREHAVGQRSTDLGFWPSAADRKTWIEEIHREGRSLHREMAVCRADGGRIDTLMSAEVIDYDDQPSILAIFVDQTERKKIEEEVIRLNVELEIRVEQRTEELSAALNTLKQTQEELVHSEKLSALGSLVAGVAHELNTPIGNAMMAASSLTDATRDIKSTMSGGSLKRSQLDEFIERCYSGADLVQRSLYRANELVLSFKQVAVDQASERRRKFALDESVREMINTLRPSLKHSVAEIACDIDEGLLLDSYPGALGQVVINLIMNAVVHGFESRESGWVRVRASALDANNIELVCSDDGRGIPAETLGRIFDPFFTTRLGKGGSGLGLSIVHRLVTQVLGGQITVESTVNVGTTFRLVLPRNAPEMAA